MAKRKKKSKTVAAAPPALLSEQRWFIPDSEAANPGRNTRLATHLNGAWNPLAIVRIERIEIGSQTGWLATYRP
jgi:hypothetical protein